MFTNLNIYIFCVIFYNILFQILRMFYVASANEFEIYYFQMCSYIAGRRYQVFQAEPGPRVHLPQAWAGAATACARQAERIAGSRQRACGRSASGISANGARGRAAGHGHSGGVE